MIASFICNPFPRNRYRSRTVFEPSCHMDCRLWPKYWEDLAWWMNFPAGSKSLSFREQLTSNIKGAFLCAAGRFPQCYPVWKHQHCVWYSTLLIQTSPVDLRSQSCTAQRRVLYEHAILSQGHRIEWVPVCCLDGALNPSSSPFKESINSQIWLKNISRDAKETSRHRLGFIHLFFPSYQTEKRAL